MAAPMLERREEVVAALVAALEETLNIGLRNAAVEALVAIGPDAVGATVDAIPRLDSDARKLAIEVLGGVADARGTAALTRALHDEDLNVRVAAAEALGNAAVAGEESRDMATEALVASLANSDTFSKIAALDSLARLEAQLPWSVFEPYARDPLLRRYAIAAAAGSREPAAVRALARATGDGSPTIAREAIVALGDMLASESPEHALLEVARATFSETKDGCANARRSALDAEDGRARGGALLLLGLLRDAVDIASLVEALGDDDVAERADIALRIFGPTAVGPLFASARHAKSHVRAAAIALAASLEGAEVAAILPALREALMDPSLEVLACAVEALGAWGDAGDLRASRRSWLTTTSASAPWRPMRSPELAARHVDAARALLGDGRSGHDPLALGCILLGAIASARARGGRRAIARARPGPRSPPRAPCRDRCLGGGGGRGRRGCRGLRACRRGARGEARRRSGARSPQAPWPLARRCFGYSRPSPCRDGPAGAGRGRCRTGSHRRAASGPPPMPP